MKVLVIGPSDTKSLGGMATVINGIRNSKVLNEKYDLDVFASFIDGNIIKRLIYSAYAFVKFLFIYKRYDLFHIHTASFGSTFRKRMYLKRIKKQEKKCIVHIHGGKYLVFYNSLKGRKKKMVTDYLKSADMVIALSDEWKNNFEKVIGIHNCYSLNNGIDTEEYKRAICDVEEYHNGFVYLGVFLERKGIYDLIDAVEKARVDNPNIKLYMAGAGEIDKVKDRITEKKLENSIIVSGWVDFEGKISLLKKSATLVLPSHNEGLPMVVLEGMSAGKTIIGTRVGAMPEVVKAENGILVEPKDVDALASALVKCSTNLEMLKTISPVNSNKIENEYSIKIMHKKLSEYYQMVMKEK